MIYNRLDSAIILKKYLESLEVKPVLKAELSWPPFGAVVPTEVTSCVF